MNEYYYFSIIIVLLGSTGLFLMWNNVARIRKRRITLLKERKAIFPVDTDSPVEHPQADFKEDGADNISKRFSIIRSTLAVLIIFISLIMAVFPFLNAVPATILSVFAGAFAVVTGIATRPFIENYFSGIIIGFGKNLKIGDTILIEKHYGTIEDITLTSTIVKLWDWRRVIIPNARMLSKEVVNYTLYDSFIWAKVEFRVDYTANLELVKKLALESAQKSSYFTGYEAPAFWIMDMEQSSYKCWLAAWSNSPANAWELGNDIRTHLISAFQQHGIKSHGFILDFKNHFNGPTN